MYNKERAKNIVKKDIRFIPAGINENVSLKSAKIETSPTGKTFIEITFEKDGATMTSTEWKPRKGQFTITDKDLQIKEDNQFSRLMQVLNCFYKDEELVFNGTTFEDFISEVADYLNRADKSILLRVKCVYNKDGYITLPSYAKYTFIEPMNLPEGKASVIAELSIDQFTKPIIADTEQPVDALSVNTSSITQSSTVVTGTVDGLPF